MAVNTTTARPTIGAADAIWELILMQSKSVQKELVKRVQTLSMTPRERAIAKIPAQYRCDPYKVSPTGDPYWADRRNVEALNRAIASADEEPVTVINSKEDLEKLFAL